jgi:RimJ/RimL family protein N-acetyltransferase
MTLLTPLPGVRLLPVTAEYAPEIHAAVHESLSEVAPWLPNLHAGLTLDDVRDFAAMAPQEWANGTGYHQMIVAEPDGALLGGIGITPINRTHMFANVYYWVRTSAAGRGAASQALRQLAPWAFAALGLVRLEIVMAVGNTASRRAAEKAGAVYEARLRNRLMMHGATHDAYMYSLIPSDAGAATVGTL